ncbi:ATP-binding protein [Nonomuraea sp. SYSU D8015]|uniref:ATP-binding protein n=1 Tax=Nonomuraea sp. SYSU D8015 TaxID=2593644 RepID=UPI00166134EE|nr:ATP-binding protein [Nonomuraea sp. SYSU D8015]
MDLLSVEFGEGLLARTRGAVLACARGEGMAGERLADLLAAVNECVVNAVEHGGGRGRLRMWRQDGTLVCEVADTGGGIPPGVLEETGLPAPSAPGGRGIWLMRRLSDEVAFTTGPGGTTVRLTLRLADDRGADPPVTAGRVSAAR